DNHEVLLDWEWAYQVGESHFRAGLHEPPGDAAYRDLAAEHALLDRLRLGGIPEDRLASARLGGLETVRFTTELLPLLTGQPGVSVEVTGDVAAYREGSDSLCIGVSTAEITGEVDWFDLGVTILAESRAIPFADVFAALTVGQSHLLLPDGAYFSLDKPELRRLAQLIREARELQDVPGDQLRISRFQAGLWDELTSLGVVVRQARTWEQQVQGLLALGEVNEVSQVPPPDGLQAQLRLYQLEGFQWLAFLWQHRLGGILADDMGLGKTLPCLALVRHAPQREHAARAVLNLA